jgi:hypothetical protein
MKKVLLFGLMIAGLAGCHIEVPIVSPTTFSIDDYPHSLGSYWRYIYTDDSRVGYMDTLTVTIGKVESLGIDSQRLIFLIYATSWQRLTGVKPDTNIGIVSNSGYSFRRTDRSAQIFGNFYLSYPLTERRYSINPLTHDTLNVLQYYSHKLVDSVDYPEVYHIYGRTDLHYGYDRITDMYLSRKIGIVKRDYEESDTMTGNTYRAHFRLLDYSIK